MKTTNLLKSIIISIGILTIILSLISFEEAESYVKPIFHILVIILYSYSIKKISLPVILFFLGALLAEFLSTHDFNKYFSWITISLIVCFSSGIFLLIPILLKSKKIKFKWANVMFILLVISGLSYIIGSIYHLSLEKLTDLTFFNLGTILFCVFIGVCFYIEGFSLYSKSVLIFLTGIGYTITCLGSLVFHLYLEESSLLIGFVNLGEIIAQYSFINFIIHYHNTRELRNNNISI